MNLRPLILLCALVLPFQSPAFAEPKTLQGEIVDPATYLKTGEHGPEHEELTYEAVDGGQTLALLEDTTGHLYLLLAEQPGEDPNELAYDYVNRKVKVLGTVCERAGLRGIVIGSIAPVDANPADTTTAPPVSD